MVVELIADAEVQEILTADPVRCERYVQRSGVILEGCGNPILSDPRWRALGEKHGYFDVPIEGIEIEVTLPPGVTID